MNEVKSEEALSPNEIVASFEDFFDKYYRDEIAECVRKKERRVTVSFTDLIEFNAVLGDMLLDKPEDVLAAAESALGRFDASGFFVRFKNLSKNAHIMIRDFRSSELNKFFAFDGVVRQKSDVRPQVTSARFECPSCGNALNVLQLENHFKEPSKCSCGRKGKFRLLTKELVDAQSIVLEEVPELLEGGEQPKRINVFLKNDLVSPLSDKKTNPGTRLIVNGTVKEVPIFLRSGGQSTRFDLVLEANFVESIQEDFSEIVITEEEMGKIVELSKDIHLTPKLVQSIAPSIYGHDKIKEALLMQMMGGVKKKRDDGVTTRGDIHILLVGDPGAAKSQMLKRITRIAPRSRYVSGKGASGAGLSAAVVKDEFLQGWALEAGALVLANKGICCIDEMDKMDKDDTSAMHEALEQQSITISKANIQATLRCETTVLAAANPKFGRFDPYDTPANQIDMPPALINRFDLIFPIKDIPDAKNDEKLAAFILERHKNPVEKSIIETQFLRKYIAHARQTCFPVITDAAIEEIKDYYLKMRATAAGGAKSIPITPRQLEGLVRLSEAAAKIRLSDKVLKKDAKKAVELLDYCLRQVAYDEKTGTIDIDRISSETSASARNKIINIKEIIADLEGKMGKVIPMEEILRQAQEMGISEADVEEVIQKLKRSGDIFEPKHGSISRI